MTRVFKAIKNTPNYCRGVVQRLANDQDYRRKIGISVSFFVIALGLSLLAIAGLRFIFEVRGIGLIAPGATLIVSGLAGLLAQLGITTWQEQRQADKAQSKYEQRVNIYARASQLLIRSFAGGIGLVEEAELRGLMALWGSREVLASYASWHKFISALSDGPTINVTLTAEQSKQAKSILSNLLITMRADLLDARTDDIHNEELSDSLFNTK